MSKYHSLLVVLVLTATFLREDWSVFGIMSSFLRLFLFVQPEMGHLDKRKKIRIRKKILNVDQDQVAS